MGTDEKGNVGSMKATLQHCHNQTKRKKEKRTLGYHQPRTITTAAAAVAASSLPISSLPADYSRTSSSTQKQNLKGRILPSNMTLASQQLAPPTTGLAPSTSSVNTNLNLLPVASLVSPIRRSLLAPVRKSSFFSRSLQPLLTPSRPPSAAASAPKFSMRVASSKQAYICRDCGYIYNDRTPFEKLADNYFCPVCGAPKRRFRVYEPTVAKNANQTDVRKVRKAQIQREETLGRALPIAIAVGILALAGLYFYINSTA
ncbi:hypothetical protein RJ641_008924 [Dillenia turbinata]|uniref:Rubredoxin-like domain-containing protein n=1 Tax=Dillenia turbinata TaxID=194707 RepID=A0AAN8VBC2_9MAGN